MTILNTFYSLSEELWLLNELMFVKGGYEHEHEHEQQHDASMGDLISNQS